MVGNVLEYLENAAEKWPERIAFADEKLSLTYVELMDSARRVGSLLAVHIQPRQPVAVVMQDRSVSCVAALLGVLYAGCPYSPLDAAMPPERMQLILGQLQPAAILTDAVTADAVGRIDAPCPVLRYEDALQTPVDDARLLDIRSRDSVYDILSILFTSGSTGMPKGVAQTQLSYIIYTEATVARFTFTEKTVFGNQSPFFYANSIVDIYPPLMLGARVYILPARCMTFPRLLVEQLREQRVSELTMTPSSYVKAAQAGVLEAGCLPDMKYVILSGEAAHWQTMQSWMTAASNADVWNFYGSTEMLSVAVMRLDRSFSEEEIIPVGRPFPLVEVLIVDEDGNPLPRGEKGEMLIANPWLCSGYYRDEARTDAAFVTDPLGRGYYTRYYRTGDLGCIGEDGMLTVLGRRDSQIKRGGYRMELGEVEVALRQISGIGQSYVIFDKDSGRLCCFWTGGITQKQIQSSLKKSLPRYALPDTYVHLEAMPYTATMKIDRQALRRLI